MFEVCGRAVVVGAERREREGVVVAEAQRRVECVEEVRSWRAVLLRKCTAEEEKHRRSVESREQKMRSAVSLEYKLALKTLSLAAKRQDSYAQGEALARRGVELDERGDRSLLVERHSALISFLAAGRFNRLEAEKEAAEAAAASSAASAAAAAITAAAAVKQLQRIGRGFLLRSKLRRRLENRRRDLLKRGITRILADEFTQRREVVGVEHVAREELLGVFAVGAPADLTDGLLPRVLQDLQKEEGSARGRILDDSDGAREAIVRAEHKQFVKLSAVYFTPEASDSSDEEDAEENAASDFGVPPPPAAVVLGQIRRASTPRRRYKGFELDALGRFLLDYESDINRMQMDLADFRRQVAFDHDQLKDARDRAAQEVVRGGTGAMWVPARPLPLSDLVRGPSTQYEAKQRF